MSEGSPATYQDWVRWMDECRERYEQALLTIAGPADHGDPYIGVYRAAGGGYDGLQAIARTALLENHHATHGSGVTCEMCR